jgi:hypothetical protein
VGQDGRFAQRYGDPENRFIVFQLVFQFRQMVHIRILSVLPTRLSGTAGFPAPDIPPELDLAFPVQAFRRHALRPEPHEALQQDWF